MVLYLLTVLSLGFRLLVECFLYAIAVSSQQSTHNSLYDKSIFCLDDIGAPKISYPQVLVFSYHSYVILYLTIFLFFGGWC